MKNKESDLSQHLSPSKMQFLMFRNHFSGQRSSWVSLHFLLRYLWILRRFLSLFFSRLGDSSSSYEMLQSLHHLCGFILDFVSDVLGSSKQDPVFQV